MANKCTKNTTAKQNLKRFIINYDKKPQRRLSVLLVIAFCIVFVIGFLFEPAKNFYQSLRDHDKLVAQYEMLVNANTNLDEEIKFLQTDEGIKEIAREKLGLIPNGESTAYVRGEEDKYTNSEEQANINPRSSYKNLKYPTT